MTIFTVVTTQNPHTVKIDPFPIVTPSRIRLLSATLPNSWFNLKSVGSIDYMDSKNTRHSSSFPPGLYSVDEIASRFSTFFDLHGSQVVVSTFTPEALISFRMLKPRLENIKLNPALALFLGVDAVFKENTLVTRLNTPTSFFVHCDLIEPRANYLNGEPSSLLQILDISGRPFNFVFYTPALEAFRPTSGNSHSRTFELSVRDSDGALFDFHGLPLQFEIEMV